MKKKTLDDKVLEIMMPVLTRKEAEEIVPKLVKNIKSYGKVSEFLPDNPGSLVGGTFRWTATEEGNEYWGNIHTLVCIRSESKLYGSTSNTPS